MNDNNSGVHTLLAVAAVLFVVIGFAVWYWSSDLGEQAIPREDDTNFNMDVKVPVYEVGDRAGK